MKRILTVLGLVLFSLSAMAAENRAVEVRVIGAGAFFDNAGYKVVRLVAADLLAERVADKWLPRYPAAQSGAGFCLELSRSREAGELETVTTALSKVTTQFRYQVTPVERCDPQG